MSDDRKTRQRKGYHHGNLREALLDATRALIAAKGAAGFSFADVARRAGVSAAAPYRHFQNREEMIAETGRRGFALLADRLEAAMSGGGPGPLAALEATALAYLAFARAEPAYFAAMSHPARDVDDGVSWHDAERRAFDALRRACDALAATAPAADRPPSHMMAMHVWALCHGVSALLVPSHGARRSPISPEELIESGLALYLGGLGLFPKT